MKHSDSLNGKFLLAVIMLCTAVAISLVVTMKRADARSIQIDRFVFVDRFVAVDGDLILSVHSPGDSSADLTTRAQIFASAGQLFDTTRVLTSTPDTVAQATVPFPLNIGNGPRWYVACVSENGFVWFQPLLIDCPTTLAYSASLPNGNAIFADYSDLAYDRESADDLDGTVDVATGVADLRAPYSLDRAQQAFAIEWYAMPYVGAGTKISKEVLLTNEGEGDFDLQFNCSDDCTTRGTYGFRLGQSSYLVPHATAQTRDTFYFRHGHVD